ncbi:MAG: hypothetical protein J1G05_06025 [Clostridiales bacterium]|nr:hypothetical protein [Clostridiales bacterium]
MKVKDIIIRALLFAGREDVVEAIDEDEYNDEQFDALRTALLCFNAVEDELARCYLPLKKTEKFCSASGEIEFAGFSERPIKILSVKTPAGKCGFEVTPEKIKTRSGEVCIEYNFAPRPKDLGDESVYSETQASIVLIAAGTAAEFSLIYGDAGAANEWEARYRREIDSIQRKKLSDTKIPPRRWV